jgi:hypothetical protein
MHLIQERVRTRIICQKTDSFTFFFNPIGFLPDLGRCGLDHTSH